MYNTISAAVSETNKFQNHDKKGEFKVDSSNYVFVADGQNSSECSKTILQLNAESFYEIILRLGPLDINFLHSYMNQLYKDQKSDLLRFYNKKKCTEVSANTAILVSEKDDKIIIAYSGNGAIWHFKGDFNSFPDSSLFSWDALNLLNSCNFSQKTKTAQTGNDLETIPSFIEIQKDKQYGDIILICTDGIYSSDLSKNKQEKGVWLRKNKIHMLKFFSYLNHFFHSNRLLNSNTLKKILKLYMQELKPFLTDDATIGILVTAGALEYQGKPAREEI